MFLPLADIFINPALIFLTGLLVGIFSRYTGTGATILMYPALLALGLPPTYSAGAGLCANYSRTAISLFDHKNLRGAMRRVALVSGLFALPGVFAGHKLLLHLNSTGAGRNILYLCYGVAVLVFAFSLYRRWAYHHRHGHEMNNPLPPLGMGWKHPLVPPGSVGKNFITVGRVIIVGITTGSLCGFMGLGAGLVGVPLYMYVLGLPASVAIATDIAAMLIIAPATLLVYALGGHIELIMALILLAGSVLGRGAGMLFTAAGRIGKGLLSMAALAIAAILHNRTAGTPENRGPGSK